MSIGRTSSPTEGKSGGAAIMPEDNNAAAAALAATNTAAANDTSSSSLSISDDDKSNNNNNSTTPTTTTATIISSSKKEQLSKKRTTAMMLTSSLLVTALLLSIGWFLHIGGGGNLLSANAANNKKSKGSSTPPSKANDNKNKNNNEVVQSSLKKHKNANRGVEGTVLKSMNRGYPLNVYLEEDSTIYGDEDDDEEDDSSDDSDDDGDDEDEENKKTLEGEEERDDEGELSLEDPTTTSSTTSVKKKQHQQSKKKEDDDDDDEEEFYDVKAASKHAQRIATQLAATTTTTTSSSSNGTTTTTTTTTRNNMTLADIEKATAAAKAVMDEMAKKGDEKQHARVWESNDEAVMKIKLIEKNEEDEEEEEDSSDDVDDEEEVEELPRKKKEVVLKGMENVDHDSSDDSKDSSDDDDGEKEKDSSDDDDDSSDDDDDETTTTKSNKKSTTTTTTTTKKNTKELLLPNLSTLSPNDASLTILNGITTNLQDRMSTMFTKAKTHECRAKIAEHFALFVNGLAMETKFPFQDWYYPSTCTAIPYYENWDDLPPNVNAHDLHHRVYQPPKESVPEGTYIDNVDELELVYVILTHDQPEATIRLIESVYVENRTKFVIHVDGKEQADETFDRLMEYAQEKNGEQQQNSVVKGGGGEYIRLVPHDNRVRVNWGGFSMVNATLVAMKTLFGLDYYEKYPPEEEEEASPGHDNPHAFSFHKMIHLASTTYPLASNTEIRDTLASYPLDANFMHILLRPNDPTPQVWNYFVECDDALHRIYRLPPLTIDKGHGIDIHTSSQWFIISREFAWYLAKPPKNSLVDYLLEYMEHVVVADESFFGTVLRNTHFCSTLHNDNFLHIQFGSWENESKAANERDARKCVMRNPDHCGRSPTTMTLDYLPVLELSGDLFARKFDDVAEPLVKDYIDKRRKKEEERFLREEELAKEIEANKTAGVEVTKKLPLETWEFQGEGVMLVAKETVLDDVPLCLGLKRDGANRVYLTPCFKEDVPPTLSSDWYTGAVIIEEIEHFNRWDIGPCSSDGELRRNETTGELEVTPGEYTQTGPKCMLKIGDSIRKGRCLDVESDRTKPGAYLNIFPCEAKWHQLFSFGNGDIVPTGGIHVSPPKHVSTKDGTTHLCLGVQGRSDEDEEGWLRPEHDDDPDDLWPWDRDNATEYYENGFKSLKYWDGIQLQTTPCSNEGAVVEFLYVPFIIEENDNMNEGEEATDNEESDADVTEKTGGAEGLVVGDEL